MKRRDYLRAGVAGASAAGLGGIAGCLGTLGFGDANPNVTLPKPETRYPLEDHPYVVWGDRVPDVELPAPVSGSTVRLRDVDRPALYTFFYTYCGGVCPVLVATMGEVQSRAIEEGFVDRVAFLPITFDPARDDAERLRTYADEMPVDPDAGYWRFLRPASRDRAKEVVQGEFGVTFERTKGEDGGDGGGNDEGSKRGRGYQFTHFSLTTLVNADGYVERSYRAQRPPRETILDHLRTVLD